MLNPGENFQLSLDGICVWTSTVETLIFLIPIRWKAMTGDCNRANTELNILICIFCQISKIDSCRQINQYFNVLFCKIDHKFSLQYRTASKSYCRLLIAILIIFMGQQKIFLPRFLLHVLKLSTLVIIGKIHISREKTFMCAINKNYVMPRM